jgi:CheY-like chemotaxis protein
MTRDECKKLQGKAKELNASLVLIIEEKLSEQRLFSLIEETVGMVCCLVSNCSEALEALTHVRFNLIILDLQIPSVEATECAKKIRSLELKCGIKTPIIAVTAHAMPGDRKKCLEAGMDDYLSKPFELAQLEKMIAQWTACKDDKLICNE